MDLKEYSTVEMQHIIEEVQYNCFTIEIRKQAPIKSSSEST